MTVIPALPSHLDLFRSSAKIIQNPRMIIICAISAAILIALGIFLASHKQIPWNHGIGIVASGTFFLCISGVGLFINRCSPRERGIPLPRRQAEKVIKINIGKGDPFPTLKQICIQYLIKNPQLTEGQVKNLPIELVEAIRDAIIKPLEAYDNAHLFPGVYVEKRAFQTSQKVKNLQLVKITKEFDNLFAEAILNKHLERSSEIFLISPQLSGETLKGFCRFLKNLQANSNFELILNGPTLESFFFDLSDEEIEIFYQKLTFNSDDSMLFIDGLMQTPEPPTKENLKKRMEKIFTVSTLMLNHFRSKVRNEDDQDYKPIFTHAGQWKETIKILQVINMCIFMGRRLYNFSAAIDEKFSEKEKGRMYFEYANWGAYLHIEEVGFFVLRYMDQAATMLFSAEN